MNATNPNNVIKFKTTNTAISQCVLCLLMSVSPFGLSITTGAQIGVTTFVLLSILSSMIIYKGIEMILPKQLRLNEGCIVFKNGPFRYNIELDKMSVYYEKVLVFERSSKDNFGLVLYRDKGKIMGMSRNNRFILDYEMDETKLSIYKNEFAEKLGVKINIVDSLF